MNSYIQKELDEFKPCHTNAFNIGFHILCGFIFMSVLLLLSKKYKIFLLLAYAILLLFTMTANYFLPILLTIFGIYLTSKIIKKLYTNLNTLQLLFVFLIFYFLPDLSHYLTGEKTVMTLENITVESLFVNIFYLLPFSFVCLFKKMYL
jgi:hypothetical protein